MTKNITSKTAIAYVVVLTRDSAGPVYLGRLDCGRQGVRRIENAIKYRTRGRAELVAADYGRHSNVVVVAA